MKKHEFLNFHRKMIISCLCLFTNFEIKKRAKKKFIGFMKDDTFQKKFVNFEHFFFF